MCQRKIEIEIDRERKKEKGTMAKRGGDREEENGINQIARNRVQRIYFASKCVYASGTPLIDDDIDMLDLPRYFADLRSTAPRFNAPRFVFILYPLRSTV